MDPALNRGLVPFFGALLGLLAAPAQPAQEPEDVRRMVPDAEQFANQIGDARQRPQVGRLALGQRTTQQLAFQLAQLLGPQPRLGAVRPARERRLGGTPMVVSPASGFVRDVEHTAHGD